MLKIGIVIFPQVEELDFVAPFEVLSYINKIQPGSTQVMLVAETLQPLQAFNGMQVLAHHSLTTCPPLDIIIVPGGKGRFNEMRNTALLQFIQFQAKTAQLVASVCTGAFLLAEAGLLNGRQAVTHHAAMDELASYPQITTVQAKVVRDGNILTAAGVASGLELGFCLLKQLFGPAAADAVATGIEYSVDIAALP